MNVHQKIEIFLNWKHFFMRKKKERRRTHVLSPLFSSSFSSFSLSFRSPPSNFSVFLSLLYQLMSLSALLLLLRPPPACFFLSFPSFIFLFLPFAHPTYLTVFFSFFFFGEVRYKKPTKRKNK